ncbi:MAG: ATP-NAD kinase [Haloferacaceae archaeon]
MNGEPADGPSVRVRGDDAVAAAVAEAGATLRPDGPADLLVAVGEDALLGLAADPPALPVLPVDDAGGPLVVPREAAVAAVAAFAAGDARRVEHPVLGVSVGDDHVGRALADVSLVTSEPARISEYAVESRGRPVAGFRADGVVVATPLGSAGYARAAGGPVLGPGTGLAVVPVAPFATTFDTWVRRAPVELSVERDEGRVSLVLDDAVVREVLPHEPVRVDVTTAVELVVPPVAGDEWKSSNE